MVKAMDCRVVKSSVAFYSCAPTVNPFCLLSDGHTDRDIVLKWKASSIQIGNKEMAQFSVGDAILSTEINTFTTGKDVTNNKTSQVEYASIYSPNTASKFRRRAFRLNANSRIPRCLKTTHYHSKPNNSVLIINKFATYYH